jgi:hypothetical protein
MLRLEKALFLGVGVGLAFVILFASKWYFVATKDPISANRGVYGMENLEIFIGINTSVMPNFAREWACKTLIAREKVAMGGRNSFPPHGCQPDYAEQIAQGPKTMMETILSTNLSQVKGLAPNATPEQIAAFETCLKAGIDAAVPQDQQALAEERETKATKLLIIEASKASRTCRAAM